MTSGARDNSSVEYVPYEMSLRNKEELDNERRTACVHGERTRAWTSNLHCRHCHVLLLRVQPVSFKRAIVALNSRPTSCFIVRRVTDSDQSAETPPTQLSLSLSLSTAIHSTAQHVPEFSRNAVSFQESGRLM